MRSLVRAQHGPGSFPRNPLRSFRATASSLFAVLTVQTDLVALIRQKLNTVWGYEFKGSI